VDAKDYAIQSLEEGLKNVPEYMHGGYRRYLVDGIEPGDFVFSVLSNDLKGAFQQADHENTAAMKEHVTLCYWHLPADAQGSREKVIAWIKKGGLNG